MDMRFVLDDQYILVHSSHSGEHYRIVRLEDGETVYSYSPEEEFVSGTVELQEDRENQRLYLYNGHSVMTGVCIDSESWESLFEIPDLYCVPDSRTAITFEKPLFSDNHYFRRPLYGTHEMVEMGEAALGRNNNEPVWTRGRFPGPLNWCLSGE